MPSGFPGSNVTDSTSAFEEEASPCTTRNDAVSADSPGSLVTYSTSAGKEEASPCSKGNDIMSTVSPSSPN